MATKSEKERILAVERYLAGECPQSIYTSLGRSKSWLYKWIERFEEDREDWCHEFSRQPLSCPLRTPDEIENIVCFTRRSLYNKGTFHGAQAILWQMEEDGVEPLPSESTIKRILRKHDLTNRRTGRYEPKGKKYPAPPAVKVNDVQQYDFVGPCRLKGPFRFYSLNALDIVSRRCAVEAVRTRKDVFASIWDIWIRLGIPRFAQFDNGLEFIGSRRHPRGMGQVIRLCLKHGVEPVFIPLREPWRNGHVEKFNDHWGRLFYSRIQMDSEEELAAKSLEFENRHNSSWRYVPLDGKTPLDFMKTSSAKLIFPHGPKPKNLEKPERGKYHVIRFIRSDLKLDVFGEVFAMPQETRYEYVTATINVLHQRMYVCIDHKPIVEIAYKMR